MFEDGLRADREQALSIFALRLRPQKLAQPPDSGIERAPRTLGVEFWPEQIGQAFTAMRSSRIGEQETSQPPSGRPELRPSPIVHTCNSKYSEQSNTEHGGAPFRLRSGSTCQSAAGQPGSRAAS